MSKEISNPGGLPHSIYAAEGHTPTPWIEHYDQGVPACLPPLDVPLYHCLDQAAAENPEGLALVADGYKITYRQLRKNAELLAANLHSLGVRKGDRVAVMMPNLPQTVMAFWGALKAGAVLVMTNPLYMGNELLYQLNDSGAKCLIAADICWQKINELRPRLGIKHYFIASMYDLLPLASKLLYKLKKRGGGLKGVFDRKEVFPFSDLLRGTERLSVSIENPMEDLAALQYTGGTTGVPKGAMLTHHNFVVNARQLHEVLRPILNKDSRFLAVLPFFHVYGLTICLILPATVGGTIYSAALFNPIETMRLIDRHKITVFPGAPSIYLSLLQHKDIKSYNFSSLRICVSGSAPLPVEAIKQFVEKTNCFIVEGYGLTEASPLTHINPLYGEKKAGTIGMPVPSTLARIVDMEMGSLDVPSGQIGELVIKGPQVMKGYWKRPDETANTLRNGWLYTGDIACMDEQGYVTIVDRKKDMAIIGGYNVYPREVDEILYTHPKIKEAVCVGIPHKTRGEILKAYVVPKAGEEISPAEIAAFCRGKLANYKAPRLVEIRAELPRSQVGKVLRRMLRDEEEAKLNGRAKA